MKLETQLILMVADVVAAAIISRQIRVVNRSFQHHHQFMYHFEVIRIKCN